MSIKEFTDLFRTSLYKKLEGKTGWGRNEIISAVEKSISDSLAEMIDRNETIKIEDLK
jgi:hypothetical protein